MRTRKSAEQRRAEVLDAAVVEFARAGLDGTSTQAIATRSGISQPYLFRLFPTKRELFLAVAARCFARVVEKFEEAVGDRTGEEALAAMGRAYDELIADRTFLLLQLQVYAGCDDEQVRAVARRGTRDIWYTIERLSGVPPEVVKQFYAAGMMCNVATAMKLDEVDERWAQFSTM